MDFQFSEEQQLLADSLAKLIERAYSFEARREIAKSDSGISDTAWAAIGEMGLMALPMAESSGGFAMGALGMVPIMECLGRGLMLEPIVPCLYAARMIEIADAKTHADLLNQMSTGQHIVTFAHTEAGMRSDDHLVAMQATQQGNDWVLNGSKEMVIHAAIAKTLLVSARVSGSAGERDGLALFFVPADAAGVSMATMRTVDNLRAADIAFDNVKASATVGTPGQAIDVIEAASDFATMLLCAEAVGAMGSANDSTLEYLKTRKQFGTTIGTFQALQHRMVDMTVSTEQARSIVYMACNAVDQAAAGAITAQARQHMVSAAKIKINEAARHVGQEAIQLHGGMGMTDEMKVSHTFKRLTMISQTLGDVDHHLERFAATEAR